MAELAFESFKNKYAGQDCIVVGKGPTDYDFAQLSQFAGPVFFINDAVCYEKHVAGDSFFFAHDAGQMVWLPKIESMAVIPVIPRGAAHRGLGIKEQVLSRAVNLVKYHWGGFDRGKTSVLSQSREELARNKQLYLHSGTMHALIHFVWFCGCSHVQFIGCDGLNNKKQLQSLSMANGYDPRIENLSGSKSWFCNAKIKRQAEMICGKLRMSFEYIGTPNFSTQIGSQIPKIAHFIWFGEPPAWVNHNVAAFREHNAGWEIKVHTSLDVLPVNLRTLANRSPRACQKSDILRYWIVHCYGGVYVDTDMYVVKSFEPLLGPDIFLPAYVDGRITNAVLGAVPNHPVLESVLSRIPNTPEAEVMGDRCVFGPTLWTRLRQSEKFKVLPHYYFEPFTTRGSAITFWKSTKAKQHEQLNHIRDRFIDGVWPYAVHLKGSQFLSRELPA